MYYVDFHTHTKYSFDSKADPYDVCKAALKRGIKVIALTDHYDVDSEDQGLKMDMDITERRAVIAELKERFSDKLEVVHGIELGQPYLRPKFSEKLVRDAEYEFVLGSVHNLKKVPDFYYLDYSKAGEGLLEKLFSRMLDDVLKLAKLPYVNSVAHITYPLRYSVPAGKNIDLKQFYPKLEKVFSEMVRTEKALEINTSPIRRGLGFTMPDAEILSLYKECGGRYVTVGSDSHKSSDVGSDIECAYEVMKKCGFDKVTVFKGGEKILIPTEI